MNARTLLAALAMAGLAGTTSAAPFAYVADMSGPALLVYDVATQAESTRINLAGSTGAFELPVAVAAHAATQMVYVTTTAGLRMIDARSNTVTGTVPLSAANELVVDPAGKTAYVLLLPGKIQVVDLASRAATRAFAVNVSAGALALSPDGGRLYVSSSGVSPDGSTATPEITVIDTATGNVRATVNVGQLAPGFTPGSIGVSPRGDKVYALTKGAGHGWSYVELDTATLAASLVNLTPPAGSAGYRLRSGGMVFNADGSRLYLGIATDYTNLSMTMNGTMALGEVDPAARKVLRFMPTYVPGIGAITQEDQTGLRGALVNGQLLATQYVREVVHHYPGYPKGIAFIDIGNWKTLASARVADQSGLSNNGLYGDILGAASSTGTGKAATTTTLTYAPTHPARAVETRFTVTVKGRTPTGKVKLSFIDYDTSNWAVDGVKRIVLPLTPLPTDATQAYAAYTLPPCPTITDPQLKKVVCQRGFDVTAEYLGDNDDARSATEEIAVSRK